MRVLIADDHPVVREGLRAILATVPGVQVVGEAGDGEEAVAKTAECRPDVILMDLRMPKTDGLGATRQIRIKYPHTKVVVLTVYDSDRHMAEALRAGALAFLPKDASRELIASTLDTVSRGGLLVKTSSAGEPRPGTAQGTSWDLPANPAELEAFRTLTARERQVLKLLVEGLTNKTIAHSLSMQEVTAKKHVQSIIAKLGVTDRTQAAVKAVRGGFQG